MSSTGAQPHGDPPRRHRKSLVVRRSVVIGGRQASVSVEDAFWKCLEDIAADRGLSRSELITAINSKRTNPNLSSALRLFVLDHYRGMAAAAAARGGI